MDLALHREHGRTPGSGRCRSSKMPRVSRRFRHYSPSHVRTTLWALRIGDRYYQAASGGIARRCECTSGRLCQYVPLLWLIVGKNNSWDTRVNSQALSIRFHRTLPTSNCRTKESYSQFSNRVLLLHTKHLQNDGFRSRSIPLVFVHELQGADPLAGAATRSIQEPRQRPAAGRHSGIPPQPTSAPRKKLQKLRRHKTKSPRVSKAQWRGDAELLFELPQNRTAQYAVGTQGHQVLETEQPGIQRM